MIWAVTAGVVAALGVLLIISGATPKELHPKAPKPPGLTSRALTAITPRFTKSELIMTAITAGIGLLITIFTGMVVAIIALPAIFVLAPKIVSSKADERRIERLEALEQWTRSLAGVLATGQGMRHTLTVSLRNTPPAIYPQVSLMVARLNARRGTEETLRQFAEDLNDNVGDSVAATLILGARETGAGLQRILDGLAETVAAEVRQRREIEAQRQGPRSEAKWLALGIPTFFIGYMVLTNLGEFYSTPLGQLALVVLTLAFLGCVWWMRTIVTPRPEPRFLTYTPVGEES